ncbi:MAG TPA: flagellar basal-body MS-ring/collar protein FliF [Caulobacteraceae bacterium]|nr:flagellar basal-body MS-ring/collar protein FliF [Caulobacteraceae bacterium]
MEAFLNGLQRFGIGRLAAIVGVSAGVAAALFALVLHVGSEPEALLYANLDLKEAASISQALDQAGIKYDAKGDGSTIMVARDKVASARLMLASKGLPTSGSVGYEIFDNTSALGQTDFVQNLNRQRALEGELARTIRSLDGVTFARVQLVLPKHELFQDDDAQPTASVVIGVEGREPSADQVRALQNLVAGAVPNLKPDRVTIVDQNARLLGGGDADAAAGQVADDARTAIEDRIRRQVKELVEGVVGPGRARVQVTADVDMSQSTTQEEKYDPDGQVARSTQTVEETAKQNQPDTSGQASASANVPGTPGAQSSASSTNNTSDSGRTEETTNYEISRTTTTTIAPPGTIKRLSVAVAVDGVSTPSGNGKSESYQPRSAQEMQHIEDLVRSAVGYNAARGDQISVINVRFDDSVSADAAAASSGSKLFDFDKNDLMRIIELVILAVVSGLIIFFVVRPLLATAGSGGGPINFAGMRALAAPGGGPAGGAAQIEGHSGESLALAGPNAPEIEQRIDIAKIEGQVKTSSVKNVAEFVQRHPEESVSILRSWLHEA